jgi:cyclohexanecarboxylate-CoA ligase
MAIATGARCVLFDRWDPGAALPTMAEEGCTFSIGATTFLGDLLHQSNVEEYSLPEFRMFVLSGSSIPRSVVEEAYDRFENITVVTGWGQTENGLVTATLPDDPIERIVTTDGKAISHCEVIVREEYEGEAVIGERGKLLMRGDSLFDGYHERPEKTAESLTDDGWLKTGDLAVQDEDGYISIEGREADFIIRGGENISASEIEEILLDRPDIKNVALVAMPDERLQERPCAYVALSDGADPVTVEELDEYLTERGVQSHKHPERVEIVEEFPRTSTGKIQKFRLREEIAEKLGMDPV